MQALVDQAMRDGALGFSTSQLDVHADHEGKPVPPNLATPEEIVALSSVLAALLAGRARAPVPHVRARLRRVRPAPARRHGPGVGRQADARQLAAALHERPRHLAHVPRCARGLRAATGCASTRWRRPTRRACTSRSPTRSCSTRCRRSARRCRGRWPTACRRSVTLPVRAKIARGVRHAGSRQLAFGWGELRVASVRDDGQREGRRAHQSATSPARRARTRSTPSSSSR